MTKPIHKTYISKEDIDALVNGKEFVFEEADCKIKLIYIGGD